MSNQHLAGLSRTERRMVEKELPSKKEAKSATKLAKKLAKEAEELQFYSEAHLRYALSTFDKLQGKIESGLYTRGSKAFDSAVKRRDMALAAVIELW